MKTSVKLISFIVCDLYDGTGLTDRFWQVQVVLGDGCELWSPT